MNYKNAGVDIELAQSALDAIKEEIGENLGLYAGLFPVGEEISNCIEPLLVSTTDGIGTKLDLLKRYKKWDVAANDLVAMNLNDLVCMGAKPLFFLDYYATGSLDSNDFQSFIKELSRILRSFNCMLLGGETAELGSVFMDSKMDISGFAVGVIDKKDLLSKENVHEGDVIVALTSNGLHSNGFSLIRKLLESDLLKFDFNLISPTKLYVKQTLKIRNRISAAAHITGGGIKGNLKRIIPEGLCAELNLNYELSGLYKELLEFIPLNEAFNVFNMGIGMIYIVPQNNFDSVIEDLKKFGEKPFVVGTVKRSSKLVDLTFMGTVL